MKGSPEYSHSADKAALRARLRAGRAGMTAADRALQSSGLRRVVAEFLGAGRDRDTPGPSAATGGPVGYRGTVAAFVGIEPEPDTGPMLASLHAAGFDVVVPVCEPDYALSWAAWRPGVPLARSVRAPVNEPTGPRRSFEDLTDIRAVLVPALGVDASGARLGQGGGYYDRFLAQAPLARRGGAPAMALVYRSELLPVGSVPIGPLDRPLDGAFTADGPHFFGPSPSRV